MAKRITLEELVKRLEKAGLKGGPIETLGPINPETRKLLKEYSRRHKEWLKKCKEAATTPLFNNSGQCPNCGSREYFQLYGGSCDKSCAKCDAAYDCIPLVEYLECLDRGR